MDKLTVEDIRDVQAEYGRRFGPAPVDVMEVGGFDELLRVLVAALKSGTPLPDPYFPDLPEDAIVA